MSSTIFSYKHIDPTKLPVFGFKIHISATIDDYKKIYSLVVPFLEKNNIPYKYIRSKKEIIKNFSVKETSAESGKFFTIYPKDRNHFLELLEQLYELIPNDLEGIYILSDRPYKSSNTIFYRYGTIKEDINYLEDGLLTLYGPNGEKWQDFQKPFFDLPSWIEDVQDSKIEEQSYLSEHYLVTKLLSENNGGNVYKGNDIQTGKGIVIKEARPYILYFNKLYKSDLRRREFEISHHFDKYIAQPIESVKEWINDFYIYEEICGEDLYEFSKKLTVFSYEKLTPQSAEHNICKYKKFLTIINKLLDLVKYFHDNDFVLHDIHPNNFVIDEKGEITLIDIEHVYDYHQKPVVGVYNEISLKSWNQIDGKLSDCHKVGNLLLYLLAKLQVKERLNQECTLLDFLLKNYGIKTNISKLINYLFSDKATIIGAIKILESIEVYSCKDEYLLQTKINREINYNICDVSFEHRVKNLAGNIIEYKKSILDKDFRYFKHLIYSEKNLGIEGVLGKIFLVKDDIEEEWLNFGLEYLISKIYSDKEKFYVPIGQNKLSPYFNNGNAGVIQCLLKIDSEKYRKTILKLADGLKFEFAQFASYDFGMIGIADALLEVCKKYKEKNYIKYVEQLLINASFYLYCEKINIDDFYPVWRRYLEVIE